MTDQDRGAYAPQNDAPLAFDPRRAGARRGPPPVTLVVSIVVLCAIAIGGVMLYRHGAREAGQAPQVVGTPPGDSSAGLQIYKTEVPPAGETPPAPAFAPPPEQPRPRPVVRPAPTQSVTAAALRPAEPAP